MFRKLSTLFHKEMSLNPAGNLTDLAPEGKPQHQAKFVDVRLTEAHDHFGSVVSGPPEIPIFRAKLPVK